MNKTQANFIESVALTIEAYPEYYMQEKDPMMCTEVSCGCILHFATFVAGIEQRESIGWPKLQDYMGLPEDKLNTIFLWRWAWGLDGKPNARQAATYLRTYIPKKLR